MIAQLPQFLLSEEVALGIAKLAAENEVAQRMLQDLYKRATRVAAYGEEKLAAFRKNMEAWFDDTMGRASEWYGQKARLLSFVFGIVVAIVLNVDSIAVAKALYEQPVLRAQVVAQAEAAQGAETSVPPAEAGAALEGLGLPVGWNFPDPTECEELKSLDVWIKVNTLCLVPGDTPTGIEAKSAGEKAGSIALKVAGWLLSGAMAAQGAPFWFDLMRKLLRVRSGS
jgi:hypothetical protein